MAESFLNSFSGLVIYYTCFCLAHYKLLIFPSFFAGDPVYTMAVCLGFLLDTCLFFPDLLHPLLPLLLHNDGRTVVGLSLSKGRCKNRRAFGADGGADGHEEAVEVVSACSFRMTPYRTYPKVAAEPSMYWPRVLIMPLGPGPKRMMLVAPKMKPMIRPTAVKRLVQSFDMRVFASTYSHPSYHPSSLHGH